MPIVHSVSWPLSRAIGFPGPRGDPSQVQTFDASESSRNDVQPLRKRSEFQTAFPEMKLNYSLCRSLGHATPKGFGSYTGGDAKNSRILLVSTGE